MEGPRVKNRLSAFGPEKMSSFDPVPSEEMVKEEMRKQFVNLDDLFMLGYASGEKEIGRFKFKMRTLTFDESKNVFKVMARAKDDPGLTLDVQDITLAYSVMSVNDVPLEDLYSGEDAGELSSEMRRVKVIRNLQATVVGELMEYYGELAEAKEQEVDKDELKK
jgi:hypothetical protein